MSKESKDLIRCEDCFYLDEWDKEMGINYTVHFSRCYVEPVICDRSGMSKICRHFKNKYKK